jgi:hypothetical protein
MDDLVIPKQGISLVRDGKGEIYFDGRDKYSQQFGKYFIMGDQNIPDPMDDVVDLELIAYNKRKKYNCEENSEEKENFLIKCDLHK